MAAVILSVSSPQNCKIRAWWFLTVLLVSLKAKSPASLGTDGAWVFGFAELYSLWV
jgi:hypothetical protein